jgi:hypothetical protein
MSEGRPIIWIRHGLTIIDDSDTFDGVPKYSLSTPHIFDEHGTLFSHIDRTGFSVMPADAYKDTVIVLYMTADDEKIILEKDGNNHYMIPSLSFLGTSSDAILHIGGLELTAAGPAETIGVLALSLISVFAAAAIAVTAYNAVSVRSILSVCARSETYQRKETENEQA